MNSNLLEIKKTGQNKGLQINIRYKESLSLSSCETKL